MKGNKRLFKKRLALILSLIMSLNTVPAYADPASVINTEAVPQTAVSGEETAPQTGTLPEAPAETVSVGETPGQAAPDETTPGQTTPDASVSDQNPSQNEAPGTQAPAEENPAGKASENTVSEDSASDNSLSSDSVPEDNAQSENAAGRGGGTSANMTIMWYIVGSDLERESMQATKDIIEVMHGISNADLGGRDTSSVNVIVETGGIKFSTDSETRKKQEKEREDTYNWLLKNIRPENKGRLEYLKPRIKWYENERWKLSANTIEPANNNNPERKDVIMTGNSRDYPDDPVAELEDFVRSTMEYYPAQNYCLMLWDHGGGAKGGFAGDERANKDNGYDYITADQMQKCLQNVRSNLKKDGFEFKKFSFVNFDACQMGGLETALAFSPFSEYLFGSEDNVGGDGEFYTNFINQFYYSDSASYNDANRAKTIETYGKIMVDDMIEFYEDSGRGSSTMAVISLNSIDRTNTKLNDFESLIKNEMEAAPLETYRNLLWAAENSRCFSGANSGLIDLRTFLEAVIEVYNDPEDDEIRTKATELLNEVKDKDGNYNNGIVRYEKHSSGEYGGVNTLGGLTVFFPFRDNYYTYKSDGNEYEVNNWKEFYDICKKMNEPGSIPAEAHMQVGGAFCAIQAIGSLLIKNLDKTDAEVSEEMRSFAEGDKGIFSQFGLDNEIQKSIKSLYGANAPADKSFMPYRLSDNDLIIETIISDDHIRYVNDVDMDKDLLLEGYDYKEQAGWISVRDYQATKNRELNLGVIPAYGDIYPVGDDKIRYTFNNYRDMKWFDMNDYPAAVYDAWTISDNGSWDYEDGDVLDPNENAVVMFPARMSKPGTYDNPVILAVSFNAGSKNVKPYGYYRVNPDRRELNRFVSWDAVEVSANFQPLSDLGELMRGYGSGYDKFKTAYAESISKDQVSFNRPDWKLADYVNPSENGYIKDARIYYCTRDIFCSSYYLHQELDNRIKATVDVTVNDENYDVVHQIEKGPKFNDSLSINQAFSTKHYNLSASYNFVAVYNASDGKEYSVSDGDLKDLEPGVYELKAGAVDKDGYMDRDCVISVSADGCVDTLSNNDFTFVPGKPFQLTVLAEDKSLNITSRGKELPWGIFKTLEIDDLEDYVQVKQGNVDLTGSLSVSFNVSCNGKNYRLENEEEFTSLRNLSLLPGAVLSFNASITMEDDIVRTTAPAEIRIGKQPLKIYGEGITTDQFTKERLYWQKKEREKNTVSAAILMGDEETSRVVPGTVADGENHKLSQILSENITSVYLDLSKVKGKGEYKDLPFGPDNGRGWYREFKSDGSDFSTEFNKYFTIEYPDDAVIKTYTVESSTEVRFLSLRDNTELAEGRIVFNRPDYLLQNNSYRVSDNIVKISGSPVKQWYMRIGNTQRRVTLFMDSNSYEYTDIDGKDKLLVISTNKADEWDFYIPVFAEGQSVDFYADYEANISNAEETGKTKFNITVYPVDPVEYTGLPCVTADSSKTGSRIINLYIEDTSGNRLTEGVDYTVSYKNNKNAATPADKKAPTMTVKGKGKKYKGLKCEVKFTILPADLIFAPMTVNKKFAPFTSKGKINVTAKPVLRSGIKIPASQYEIGYRDEYGDPVSAEAIKNYYKGTEAVPVEIFATAIKPAKGVVNYRTGSTTEGTFVTGYPKGSTAMTVKLKSSKEAYEAGKIINTDELAKARIKTLKVKKTVITADKLKPVKAYYDSGLTKPVGEDGSVLDSAGSYYLAFELKDEFKAQNKCYTAKAVKYTLTGAKINSKRVSLEKGNKTVLAYKGPGTSLSVALIPGTDPKKGFNAVSGGSLYLTFSQCDGSTYSCTAGYESDGEFDFYIKNGMIIVTGVDNGAKGKYSVKIEGRGSYTGSFKQTYTVK